MYKKKENPLRLLPADPEKRGKIKIRLEDILKERDISLNQLSFRAEMQRTQLRNYRDNKVQRLDIDILLRLCYVLECDLTDLIEYIPPEDERNADDFLVVSFFIHHNTLLVLMNTRQTPYSSPLSL